MATETEALDVVRRTFVTLEEHRERWRTAVAPHPTSALAADDKRWPSMPLGQQVRQCLVTAWDHFDLVKLTVERQRGYPTATNSVIRGALLGGAQALWALLPDEPSQRQERGLMLAQEWYFRRIEWQQERPPSLAVDEAARSGEQLKRLDDDLRAVRRLRTTTAPLRATRCVREAALSAFGSDELARSCVGEWRRLGGDAHALGWPLMGQATTWGERGADGLAEARVLPDLVSLANAYLCAWKIYTGAVERLDDLSEARPGKAN